jgi:hypothetical protein
MTVKVNTISAIVHKMSAEKSSKHILALSRITDRENKLHFLPVPAY